MSRRASSSWAALLGREYRVEDSSVVTGLSMFDGEMHVMIDHAAPPGSFNRTLRVMRKEAALDPRWTRIWSGSAEEGADDFVVEQLAT